MAATISFNPYATNQPATSFASGYGTQGYIQGVASDDPSSRLWLMTGVLAATETLPMWGGVPVGIAINNTGNASENLGPSITRATTQGTTLGFSVFNQANHMVITPGNSVPLIGSGGGVSVYRIGSGQVRCAVQCDPALIAALTAGELINGAALYWDVTNYRITLTATGGNFALPTSIQLLSTNTNSEIISYNSGTGAVTWTAGDAALIAF